MKSLKPFRMKWNATNLLHIKYRWLKLVAKRDLTFLAIKFTVIYRFLDSSELAYNMANLIEDYNEWFIKDLGGYRILK